jgi:outer membrane protein assembly factor BamB
VKNGSKTSRLVALDKNNGREVWNYDMDVAGWSPSSPVPVYTAEGQGYIVQCDWNGNVTLIRADAKACKAVYKLRLKTDFLGLVLKHNNFEATPVVFGNTIVVGSRSQNLFFIKIT